MKKRVFSLVLAMILMLLSSPDVEATEYIINEFNSYGDFVIDISVIINDGEGGKTEYLNGPFTIFGFIDVRKGATITINSDTYKGDSILTLTRTTTRGMEAFGREIEIPVRMGDTVTLTEEYLGAWRVNCLGREGSITHASNEVFLNILNEDGTESELAFEGWKPDLITAALGEQVNFYRGMIPGTQMPGVTIRFNQEMPVFPYGIFQQEERDKFSDELEVWGKEVIGSQYTLSRPMSVGDLRYEWRRLSNYANDIDEFDPEWRVETFQKRAEFLRNGGTPVNINPEWEPPISSVFTYDDTFTDVDNDWSRAGIVFCYEKGLMNGRGHQTFAPQENVTVAEVVAVAARLRDMWDGGVGEFSNIGNTWYDGAVNYAISTGIIKEGQFDSYTREASRTDVARVLAHTLDDKDYYAINYRYRIPDVTQGSSPYYDDIALLYKAGILTGSDEYLTFRPEDYITRAELAAILCRMVDITQRQLIADTGERDTEERAIYKTEANLLGNAMTWIRTGGSQLDTIIDINQFIAQNMRYDNEYAGYYWVYTDASLAAEKEMKRAAEMRFNNSTSSMLATGFGVCSDYARLVRDMCGYAGIECLCKNNSFHEWNHIKIDGVWVQFDATGNTIELHEFLSYGGALGCVIVLDPSEV